MNQIAIEQSSYLQSWYMPMAGPRQSINYDEREWESSKASNVANKFYPFVANPNVCFNKNHA